MRSSSLTRPGLCARYRRHRQLRVLILCAMPSRSHQDETRIVTMVLSNMSISISYVHRLDVQLFGVPLTARDLQFAV